MKILISPAKSLDLETPIPVTNHSDLMFESAVKEVQQQLKSFKAFNIIPGLGFLKKEFFLYFLILALI